MPFSNYLNSVRSDCRELVAELSKTFEYVSVLGTDIKATVYSADMKTSTISEGNTECGFVLKMHSGGTFYEYSLSDLSGNKRELAQKIIMAVSLTPELFEQQISADIPDDEPLQQDFVRENDFDSYTDDYLIGFVKNLSAEVKESDDHVLNATASISYFTVSKLFLSKNRELSQYYAWANARVTAVYSGKKTVMERVGSYGSTMKECLNGITGRTDELLKKCKGISNAGSVQPGVYECITDPSITGLIAHEAFGHGVEMDQFVKKRALAANSVGEYVASSIASMHDGAASCISAASYFFDDDGVLASDTVIIKDGILKSGLSDLASACQLHTKPTGNGRRQSYKRKAYSRMTNTFFEEGTSSLEEMIASIKHGYMLFETNNGMEDPKNWQIQCTAEYGIEIIDGKLTENYVSPVVMSGYVPDLLKSISMVSTGCEVHGEGSCGKGYKEWVRVSDGGPCLKARIKLS